MSTVAATDPREILAGRVSRGAEFEDATNPGWAVRIDGKHLDMESCFACVVGQLHGFYLDTIDRICPDEHADMALVDAWARDHGFCADLSMVLPRKSQCAFLRGAWLAEIVRRTEVPKP